MSVGIEIIPVEGLEEVRPGDEVAALLGPKLAELGWRHGDVVGVTQKIVSKAEGRIVPDGGESRTAWAEREARRIVARRGDLVIAETRHGFVCANAGVDAYEIFRKIDSGEVRGLLSICFNPKVSLPDNSFITRALEKLEAGRRLFEERNRTKE